MGKCTAANDISSTSHVPRVKPHEYLWLMHVISICRNFHAHAVAESIFTDLMMHSCDEFQSSRFPVFPRNFLLSPVPLQLHQTRPIPWPNFSPQHKTVPLRSSVEWNAQEVHTETRLICVLQFWELSPSFAHKIINLECKFPLIVAIIFRSRNNFLRRCRWVQQTPSNIN